MIEFVNKLTTHLKIFYFSRHHLLSILASLAIAGVPLVSTLGYAPLVMPCLAVVSPFLGEAEQTVGALEVPSALMASHPCLSPSLTTGAADSGDNALSASHMTSLITSLPARLPATLDALDDEDQRKVFIDLLLPTVMVALDEVKQERQQLLAIIDELGGLSAMPSFAGEDTLWQQKIGADKANFILRLTQKYRTERARELVGMVNVLPPSLIIAQGALESGWGVSRSALEDHNLFGMYGSSASFAIGNRERIKAPKIVEYESVLDSVRSYVLNINRLSAYRELRKLRRQTLDSMQIADGLSQYSERKGLYIADVKKIIIRNKLQDFDTLILGEV